MKTSLLGTIDWLIIGALFLITLGIGLTATRRAGASSKEFFLSGRSMPWWLLGVSMVATTFAIDTPNLVTELVRNKGVAGNWVWWAFLLSGMLTVLVFAKLWRRSGVMTDVEFYELRYSGRPAAFLRGFRALYLGLIFNVLVMGAVSLAAIKFGQIVLGIEPWLMLSVSGLVILAYSSLGGLRGVILTDFFQFIIALTGSVWAAIFLVNHERVGGLTALFADPRVQEKMELMPSFSDPSQWIPLFLLPLAIVWWSSYFPGAEPGGGGYVAQRMFSAKNERHAMGATLFFNIAHYALRPWPWIIIALASIVVFPTVESLKEAFPHANESYISDDAAYPAMLTLLPTGLIGLISASLIAAYMSTMSTQVNLGASYLVNDFYKRFIKPDASEKELVRAGRLATVITLVLGCGLGLALTDAGQAFMYILLLGAGTGAIYILRWFWWRINAVTEIVAMIVSLIVATFFTFVFPNYVPENPSIWWQLASGIVPVLITTAAWVITAFMTKPTDQAALNKFCKIVKPGGPGWASVRLKAERDGINLEGNQGEHWEVPSAILCAVWGCLAIYSSIFAAGYWIYGRTGSAILFTVSTIVFAILLFLGWRKIQTDNVKQYASALEDNEPT
jgi:SSS family solute:Na+ symporter